MCKAENVWGPFAVEFCFHLSFEADTPILLKEGYGNILLLCVQIVSLITQHKDQPTFFFFVKTQKVNILDFESLTVSVTKTELCCCNTETAIDNT